MFSARIAFKNSPGGFAEAVRFFHGLRRHCAGNGACRSIGLSDSIVRLFVGSLGSPRARQKLIARVRSPITIGTAPIRNAERQKVGRIMH